MREKSIRCACSFPLVQKQAFSPSMECWIFAEESCKTHFSSDLAEAFASDFLCKNNRCRNLGNLNLEKRRFRRSRWLNLRCHALDVNRWFDSILIIIYFVWLFYKKLENSRACKKFLEISRDYKTQPSSNPSSKRRKALKSQSEKDLWQHLSTGTCHLRLLFQLGIWIVPFKISRSYNTILKCLIVSFCVQ